MIPTLVVLPPVSTLMPHHGVPSQSHRISSSRVGFRTRFRDKFAAPPSGRVACVKSPHTELKPGVDPADETFFFELSKLTNGQARFFRFKYRSMVYLRVRSEVLKKTLHYGFAQVEHPFEGGFRGAEIPMSVGFSRLKPV